MKIKEDYSDVEFKNNEKLKLLIIVGTRPEIIRLAAVINKCRKYFDVVLAHTGQNYDYNLNGIFFENLRIADPEVYMNAVGDDLGATVGNIINCSYKLMKQIKPDALLILGDTNSCLSAISAKRVCLKKQIDGLWILFRMLIWLILNMQESICMNVACQKRECTSQDRQWQKCYIRILLRLKNQIF